MQHTFTDKEFDRKGALLPFVKRLFTYSFRYKKHFWGLVISILFVGIIDASFPFLWKTYLDKGLIPLFDSYSASAVMGVPYTIDTRVLWKFGIVYGLASIISALGVAFFVYFAGFLQEKVIFDLRKAMFEKLQRLSFSYYDKSAIGWLITRITSDTDRVSQLISWGFMALMWGIVMIIFSFGFMFYYSPILGLIVLVTLPLLVVVSIRVRMLVLKYARQARKINSDLTANYNEHINGVEVNKSTVQENRVSKDFKKVSERMRFSSFRASYYTAMYVPIVIMIGSLATALVMFFGGKMVMFGAAIGIGTFTMFLFYARSIFEPILDITHFYALAQDSLSAGERIFSLIDEEIDIKDAEGVTDYDELKGNIEFRNLDFYYNADKPILTDFNFKIEAGQSIALVGPTGEGKTTISNVIARFYEPKAGELLIDGVDYRERSLHSFRNQLGVILQSPHLFSGSILDNVRFGNDDATKEDIIKAFELIGAEEFIDRLDEEVGEEGDNLSNGEKQMVSIVRVIVKNPRILIMDEATSSIDTIAEMRIQKGIDYLVKGRTSIIIAHRLSTIKNCDQILVIKEGNIHEKGSHQELIASKGFYHELYSKQRRNG